MSADPPRVGAFEILDDRLRPLVLGNAAVETLGSGYRWLEGPVWLADADCLLVSDLPNDRILRWSEGGGVSVFRAPSRFANGKCRDREGRLIACSHEKRWVERTEHDGTITVLASAHDGKRLNAPNDVVCRSDGTIWFTDPVYGLNTDYEGGKGTSEQPPALYRFDPATDKLMVAAGDLAGPNGLAFSPDERLLYVSDTGDQFLDSPRCIRRFAVAGDGTLSGGEAFQHVMPGYADGFKLDVHGNLWTSAGDGVHVLAPDGTLLGRLPLGCTVSNLVFGGRNRSQLFVCASHALLAVYTNTRGCVRP